MIVTGYNSMIGSRFLELAKPQVSPMALLALPKFDLVAATESAIFRRLINHNGEALVHFAAFTDVDGAEAQRNDKKGLCWQLNVEVTRKLVGVAKKLNLKIIYISTDFVFDGKSGPYSETDGVAKVGNDISWYGWTKLVGERIIQEELPKFLIARTSYPYRANFFGKLDFVRNIITGFQKEDLHPMFFDQFLTPTFIDNLSRALDLLLKENQIGIWHVVDNTTISAYDVAVDVAKVFGFDPQLVQKSSAVAFQTENPTAAKRPPKGGLRNDKLREFLGKYDLDMQDFPNALLEMKKQQAVVA